MVLKPQLQELLSKQFFQSDWDSRPRKRHLMLAVVSVTRSSLFLTDGILVIQTSRAADLSRKFRTEPGFDLELADLEGFVCLFENCKIRISDGEDYAEPQEGELVKMFRKKDFRSEIKKGPCDSGHGKLRNLEREEGGLAEREFHVGHSTVIDLARTSPAKVAKLRKRISKKNKSRRKRTESVSTDESSGSGKASFADSSLRVIDFQLDFDHFSVICPNGKHFLSGKREMMVNSLTPEQMMIIERKFKLERHIERMNDPGNQATVPVLELGDILDPIECREVTHKADVTSKQSENRTLTSTPTAQSKEFTKSPKQSHKLRSKKKRNKRKRHHKS